MSFPIKRKRGRPRRDEPPQINDFDLSLIREFQQRPAFFDRTHLQYRNRDSLEPLWQEMSKTLGHSVTIVKNRMMQLRNRYNLEKRRVEELQGKSNNPNISSPWVLYDHLNFLGDHIKARRSFANQTTPRNLKDESSALNSSDEDEYIDDVHGIVNDCVPDIEPKIEHRQTHRQEHNNYNHTNAISTPNHDSESGIGSNEFNVSTHNRRTRYGNECLDGINVGTEKFKAFGRFLVSSLLEMGEKEALGLVEKFTSDLVKSLISEQKKQIRLSDVSTTIHADITDDN